METSTIVLYGLSMIVGWIVFYNLVKLVVISELGNLKKDCEYPTFVTPGKYINYIFYRVKELEKSVGLRSGREIDEGDVEYDEENDLEKYDLEKNLLKRMERLEYSVKRLSRVCLGHPDIAKLSYEDRTIPLGNDEIEELRNRYILEKHEGFMFEIQKTPPFRNENMCLIHRMKNLEKILGEEVLRDFRDDNENTEVKDEDK